MRLRAIAIFSIALFTGSNLWAGGFQLNQQGHKSTALGGAFTGLCSDASSIFYNPGGLYRLKGHQFVAGAALIDPAMSLQTAAHYNIDQNSNLSTPIQFYYSGNVWKDLRIGLGVNNQFGSRASYEEEWQGMFIVQDISLKTYMFQPTVSYSLWDRIGIGAGFVYSMGSFDFSKAVPLASDDSEYGIATLNGASTAMGFNVGIHATLVDKEVKERAIKVMIGADYRHSLKMNLEDGEAMFDEIPSSLASQFPATTGFNATLNLPAVWSAGFCIEHQISEKINAKLLYDVNRTDWSSYDSLKFDFTNESTPDAATPKNWKNSYTQRLGLEVGISDKLFVRCGMYSDESPIPDGRVSPETVDNDHIGYTGGVGYKINDMIQVDFAYLRSNLKRMNASHDTEGFSASYHRIVNVYTLGVHITIDKEKKIKTDDSAPLL